MEGESPAPKESWLQKQKKKFLPQHTKPVQKPEATVAQPHTPPQELAVTPVHHTESSQAETEVIRPQSIDTYDPQRHQEAASHIEPRLVNLPQEEAEQRRGVIGIINGTGRDGVSRDWIFVDVSNLPVQTDDPDYGPAFDSHSSTHLQPGEYSYNNGLTVVNAEGRTYMSALQYLNEAENTVVADGLDALHNRNFREGSGYVPYSMWPSTAKGTRAALLNAAAPNLAEDYMPKFPNAGLYRFYNTDQGEVVSGIPPQPPLPSIDSPHNGTPQINAPK